jgi:hypothetical protein
MHSEKKRMGAEMKVSQKQQFVQNMQFIFEARLLHDLQMPLLGLDLTQ